jgi:predicted PurR-regulated permease PerM
MNEASPPTPFRAGSLFLVLAVAAVLYLAQAVFIPLALALLLAFLLAPLIRTLERLGLARAPSVLLVVLASFVILSGIITLMVLQTVDLTDKLPAYRETMDLKLAAVRGRIEGLERLTRAFDEFDQRENKELALPTNKGEAPVRVRIVENRLQLLGSLAGPLLAPVATGVLVLAFVVFMLLQWDDLRDRILRLSGQARLIVTTRALEDASRRVSYYLQVQLLINAFVGLSFGVGVWLIGIPNAPLAAILLITLRFIPYVGAWIAACFPLFIAFAANRGWTPLLMTLGVFGALEILAGQVLEPLFYRSKTGLSPVGVLISFLFWGWMWGGVGLLLATPLTVCLVVAAQYIPQIEVLSILLSDQRALPPWARLYHRLLALDTEEAATIVDAARERTSSQAELYDTLFVPALASAERDRRSEQLSEERTRIVYSSLEHFVLAPGSSRKSLVSTAEPAMDVLCIPAQSAADHISALMASQLLEDDALASATLSHELSLSEVIEAVATRKPRIVLVAALPQLAAVSVHERCRKLRDLFPELAILVAVWAVDEVSPNTALRWRAAGADEIVQSFAGVVQAARDLLRTGRRELSPLSQPASRSSPGSLA